MESVNDALEHELPEIVWSFGFGANMNAENLAKDKELNILEHKRAIVHGWGLKFDIKFLLIYTEPAFANIEPRKGDQVHGVAFKMPRADAIKLINYEFEYDHKLVNARTYDGEEIENVLIFTASGDNHCWSESRLPSLRYKKILLNGAKEARLDPQYIQEKIIDQKHYEPCEEILATRRALIEATIKEGNLLDLSDPSLQGKEWCSIFGHIFEPDWQIAAHLEAPKMPDFIWKRMRGKDLSKNSSPWAMGISENFTRISESDADAVQYMGMMFDSFAWASKQKCIGLWKAYFEIQTEEDWALLKNWKPDRMHV